MFLYICKPPAICTVVKRNGGFFATLLFALLLVSPHLQAQILATDSIQAEQRYSRIQYFTDTYTNQLQLVDTLLQHFEVFQPTQKGNFEALFLGNSGQPHAPLVFNYERQIGFSLGWRQFNRYFIQPDSVRYFYSLYPFSDLRYTIGPQQEQQMGVLFSIPISSNLNITADYKRIVAPGIYSRQKAKTTAFASSIRYSTSNQRYQLLGNYTLNKADTEQSGGYNPDVYFRNQLLNGILDTLVTPRTIIVPHLGTAKNVLSQKRAFVQQTYSIGKLYNFFRYAGDTLPPKFPTLKLGHRFVYDNQRNDYQDTAPNASSYYPNFFVSTTQTRDSLSTQLFDNEAFVAFFGRRKLTDTTGYEHTISARAALRHQYGRIAQTAGVDTIFANLIEGVPQDTTFVGNDTLRTIESGMLVLHFENPPKSKINYWLDASYGLWGTYQNDISVSGRLFVRLSNKIGWLQAGGTLQSLTPDYLTNFYFSNHYQWNNPNFKKTNSLQLNATYYNPSLRLQLGYQNHTIDNYVVWQPTGQPDQLSSQVVNISQFTLKKDFTFWQTWHLDNRIVVQLSSNSQVPLPLWCSWHSLYWQSKLFKGATKLQIGMDVRSNGNYYAPGYLPAIGQFFVQNTEKQTYYPIADVFLTAKVKRLRLFAKMQHVNQGLFKQKSYYSAYQHPAQDRAFYFGVSWMFYD
jgi:hypothetical protein